MRHNNYGGLFIAFDGPNGVGKSTLIRQTADVLMSKNIDVYTTKEPTDTELGKYIRQISEYTNGNTLACLVAADRYHHLEKEIIPQLKAGKIVITDRYVLSSLILQRIDGVDKEFILETNREILAPDLQIALYADIETIQTRLDQRNYRTRFENDSKIELEYLQTGIDILKELRIKVCEVDNSNDLISSVNTIFTNILEVLNESSII